MDDGLNYSLEARLRGALSNKSAQASTVATSLVPAYGEYGCPPGELAELAGHLADTADEALTYAIACERERGTSWERIAGGMGRAARGGGRGRGGRGGAPRHGSAEVRGPGGPAQAAADRGVARPGTRGAP